MAQVAQMAFLAQMAQKALWRDVFYSGYATCAICATCAIVPFGTNDDAF